MENRKHPKDELKYYGRHAVREIFRQRSEDIIRVYVTKPRLSEFAELLQFCASKRLAYHVVTDAELEKISHSTHHEGVCLLAKAKPPVSPSRALQELEPTGQLVLLLDGVGNPHNLGALMRLAAHFGVRYLVGDEATLPKASPSAVRVAEGGAEHCDLVRVAHLPQFVGQLKKIGYQVFGTSSHEGLPYTSQDFPAKTALILGGEVFGMGKELGNCADAQLQIPGSGKVESLNVAAAAAILVAQIQGGKLSW